MADVGEILAKELDQLRTVRDELRVKLHLGGAEAKERWEQLEKSWSQAEAKLRRLRDESKEDLDHVSEAARNLLNEIRAGYEHVKSLF